MKTVVAAGSYDFFHYGHLKLLQQARELGDRLIVLVDTDEWLDKQKGKRHIVPLNERTQMLLALRCVDTVGFVESGEHLLKQLKAMNPAYYVKGGEYDLGSLKPFGIVQLLKKMDTKIEFIPMVKTDTRVAIGLVKTFKELFVG